MCVFAVYIAENIYLKFSKPNKIFSITILLFDR